MKRIGIVTLNDDQNFGCRLQNYALQTFLNSFGYKALTLRIQNKQSLHHNKIETIKHLFIPLRHYQRDKHFCLFNRYINFKFYTDKNNVKSDDYTCFFVGSDQVWNTDFFWRENALENNTLSFVPPKKRNSFSASFGTQNINDAYIALLRKELSLFNQISVREESGVKIAEELTGRDDIEVHVDPTMLISSLDWQTVSKKPKELKKGTKFILNYFIGGNNEHLKEIELFAQKHDCIVINIMDPVDKCYASGPSEFLWLEENAFCIFTDSFHSSVFAILFQVPFLVFPRTNEKNKTRNMNSRLDTLLNKFDLNDRRYSGTITDDLLSLDFSACPKILENERRKAERFIQNCLSDIKES